MAISKSRAIKNGLVTLLTGLQLNAEPAFVSVLGTPRGEFNGYPSARVLPGDQTTTKGAIGQNDRSINLIVQTHVESQTNGSEFDYTYDITDLIIDTLDQADFTNALNLSNVDITSYILNASRGDWYEADGPSGPLLLCDINVEVSYSKDL